MSKTILTPSCRGREYHLRLSLDFMVNFRAYIGLGYIYCHLVAQIHTSKPKAEHMHTVFL